MPKLKKIIHFFLNLPILKWLINQSKKKSFPGYSGVSIFEVCIFFLKQIRNVSMTERASAIAFNFVMAIPPSIIFLFTLIPLFPISKEFEISLYGLIRDIVPGKNNSSPLISFLSDFINHPRNGLLSVGFLLSIFFSSNGMMGIMRSFNKNYYGFKKRNGLEQRKIAIRMTMFIFLMILFSISLLVMQGAVLKKMGITNSALKSFIEMARWVVIVILIFSTTSIIYHIAPAVHDRWPIINPGSIIATALILVFLFLFSYWVLHLVNYNKLYGSIGTLLILMLFIYFNSLVLLIGFELNVSIFSLHKMVKEKEFAKRVNEV